MYRYIGSLHAHVTGRTVTVEPDTWDGNARRCTEPSRHDGRMLRHWTLARAIAGEYNYYLLKVLFRMNRHKSENEDGTGVGTNSYNSFRWDSKSESWNNLWEKTIVNDIAINYETNILEQRRQKQMSVSPGLTWGIFGNINELFIFCTYRTGGDT